MTPDFDPRFPCACCNEPVLELSLAGPAVCPWCDCGVNRDGSPWDTATAWERVTNFRMRLDMPVGVVTYH